MILDYQYNKFKGQFSVSYTKENGGKGIIKYNINKFKSYEKDKYGKFKNWDGTNCREVFIDNPKRLEFLTFLRELPQKDKDLLQSKYSPAHYAFDIEVECGDNDFPEPSEAKYPILTISIVNPQMECVVLGTKYMDDPENVLQTSYREYLNGSEFYRNLGLNPTAKYIHFSNEGDMIDYFLKNIVSKCPVLTGWNCLGFDWQYIVNRVKFFFPDISINKSSPTWTMSKQGFWDFRGEKHELPTPAHTLILDMMDIIDADFVVMPQKESMTLDYIASECPVHLHKIQYKGDLQQLYENDYPRYVFYNAIDSALVQLIDKAFGTLGNFEMQAQYCGCKISDALGKIKLTETLFFNYFYDHGIKVVLPPKFNGDRGDLWGAYVREPTPGKHKYVCCNDFASLYPSAIITCNLSIENYLGNLEDRDFTQEEIEVFKKNPNYFVSVNNSVYKNDKDYAFKIIQKTLKEERGKSKYLSKQLDATVMRDLEHMINGRPTSKGTYKDNIIKALEELDYSITCADDLRTIKDTAKLKMDIQNEIRYLSAMEQAIKILMNSMYGGSSHIAFMFFNIRLANDITGEARNLIHLMESHIPQWFQENWLKSKELHEKLGISVRPEVVNEDANQDIVKLIYGDTDSLYISYDGLLKTIEGSDKWSKSDTAKFIVNLNENFLNDHNKEFMKAYYKTRHCKECIHEFELETVNYSGVWLNVKKRYAQILLWKDGKYYDEDNLPLKVKGLEIVKSSYPKFARNLIKGMVMTLLTNNDSNLNFILNKEMQKAKKEYYEADLDAICPSISVNGYFKYVLDDSSTTNLKFADKAPAAVKGLAMYNAIRQEHNLPGEPDYNGKHRWYIIKTGSMKKNKEDIRFCYRPSELPKWAEQYAPIDRKPMFEQMVLDPINRIIVPCGLSPLSIDGEIQFDLFSAFC